METGVAFGPYRLLKRLGQGGMSEVFLAVSSGPSGFRKQLAIKRLLPHLAKSPMFTELFLQEARRAALLDHPHLAQVWGCGEVEGRYYLAMEYVDGVTLSELVRTGGALDPSLAAAIAVDLLDALHAVHSATDSAGIALGLVHRDVTPRNVMVTRSGAVKLLDFGIAVSAGDEARAPMGTAKYASPEQTRGESVDARSDLYSSGALLHFLVTGRAPSDDPAAPIGGALEPIVRRALEADPRGRFDDARAMSAALESIGASWSRAAYRAALAELVARMRPSLARRALSRVSKLTLTVFGRPAPATISVGRASRRKYLVMAATALAAGALVYYLGVETPEAPAVEPIAAPLVEAPPRTPAPAPAQPQKRERARTREDPPNAAVGYLSVDTRPWTEVQVDARSIGTTPLERVPLPRGRHRITLTNATYGIEKTIEVVIRAREVSTIRRTFDVAE